MSRVPGGHPEGYLEGFATIYAEAARAIRAKQAGQPVPEEVVYPTIEDGVTGFLVPDQQPAILADRLRFLLQVEPLRRAFGRRAAAAAQQYAWSHVADQIIAQYVRLGAPIAGNFLPPHP